MNNNRDVLYYKKSRSNTVNYNYSSNNSLNLSANPSANTRKLVEITPQFRTNRVLDRIEYTKIRDFLNIKTLKEIVKNHSSLPAEVSEDEEYFSYQYPKHDRIYISKRTWRVYAEVNNEHTQYQAFRLLRWLAKYGYVEGFGRIQKRRFYNIGGR